MSKNILAVLLLLLTGSILQAQQQRQQPNILVILADDLGWADLGVYGSTFYETPVLDSLAGKGLRFTQGYATCPVCSPSRASLMTGKYPVNTGVTDWIRGRQENGKARPYEKLIAHPTAYQLALEETTIAEYAKSNGYTTFFAGKWHLGEEEQYWPDHQGFQYNLGGWSKGSPNGKINDSTGGFFTPYANPKLKDGPRGEYLTDRLTNECLDFIDQHKGSPFFMMYSLYAVHNPMQAPAALVKKYEAKKQQLGIPVNSRFARDEPWMKYEKDWKRRLVQDNPVYAAMMENMDSNIGRILAKLKAAGIADNTVILFTSDNGGLSTAEGSPTVNGPLRGGKGWLYEGGIRVPYILYWKGHLKAGTVSDIPITTADIYPTLARIMQSSFSPEKTIDGVDIFKLLAQPAASRNRTLYWFYPHYSNQGGKPGAAIRQGRYKLIYHYEDQQLELFDLQHDISEKNNLVTSHPTLARQLQQQLFQWLRNTAAVAPERNPGYDPAAIPAAAGQDDN